MAIQLYKPFEHLDFNPPVCFLTGKKISSTEQHVSVFPEWLLDRYSLKDKTLQMLEERNVIKYQDLKLPCFTGVIENTLNPLEEEIKQAFSLGYEEVKKIPEERLFQWMAKFVYGILYHDIIFGMKEQKALGETFTLSHFLIAKFKNLHFMLQSLVLPMEFNGVKPWTIRVVKLKYSQDVFNYKDSTNNLDFTLGMSDFGIVACLQDNGENGIYHKDIIDKIANKTLHPIQFEELCGRFIYSNYLLKKSYQYKIHHMEDSIHVEAVPLSGHNEKDLFLIWEDNMYGQVLANYWKPWGITMKDIITFGNSPISYLINEATYELIEPETISLPY